MLTIDQFWMIVPPPRDLWLGSECARAEAMSCSPTPGNYYQNSERRQSNKDPFFALGKCSEVHILSGALDIRLVGGKKKMKVLLIEDSKFQRTANGRALTRAGYDVRSEEHTSELQ